MSDFINLLIVSEDKILTQGSDISMVSFPGKMGSFSVMPGRIPIISELEKGTIRVYHSDENTEDFDIEGGYICYSKSNLKVAVKQ